MVNIINPHHQPLVVLTRGFAKSEMMRKYHRTICATGNHEHDSFEKLSFFSRNNTNDAILWFRQSETREGRKDCTLLETEIEFASEILVRRKA